MDLLKNAYIDFLSKTNLLTNLDIIALLNGLKRNSILSIEEADFLANSEKPLEELLKNILPNKGPNGYHCLESIIRLQNGDIADELIYSMPKDLLAILAPEILDRENGVLEFNLDVSVDESTNFQIASMNVKVNDDPIGQGGFANVYSGTYRNQRVAIKQFLRFDEINVNTFLNEVEKMSRLDHPNVVRSIGFVYEPEDSRLWLLGEVIEGGSMRRFCPPRGDVKSLSKRQKLQISACCWSGLDYLHSRRLCHKDISPDNILISTDLSQVKICDFGLSEIKGLIMLLETTESGKYMYYPPELGQHPPQRHPMKSDVYSMAASICELFSEQYFWHDTNGSPQGTFGVLAKLFEQHRISPANVPKPDCWAAISSDIQDYLFNGITADCENRWTSDRMYKRTIEILESMNDDA